MKDPEESWFFDGDLPAPRLAEVRALRPYTDDPVQQDPTLVDDLFPAGDDIDDADDAEFLDDQEPDHDDPAQLIEDQLTGDQAEDEPDSGDLPGAAVQVAAQPVPDRVLVGEVVRWRQSAEPRRVFAPWLADPVERRLAGAWAVRHAWYVAAFHAVRLPLYAARTIAYSPRGGWRVAREWKTWAFDGEGRPLRQIAVERGEHAAYLALSRQRNQRVKTRLAITGGTALAAVVAARVSYATEPAVSAEALWVGLFVAVVVLGWKGRRIDRPLIESAVINAPGAKKLTADMLVRAFTAAKLCTVDDPITFVPPGVFRDGAGFGAVLDVPYGTKAATALHRLEDIAAALDVDEVRLFLDRVRGDTGSARRVALWLADRDPYAVKPPNSPLVEAEAVDFWKGFPFGIDARGRLVVLNLVWTSLLVGAIPRMGKTFAARLPVAAAALDPFTKLIVADGKGGKDWRAFERVAHWYGSGVRRAVAAALLSVLKDAVADMNRRYDLFQTLPDHICPEGKLTPELSRDPRYDLPLVIVAIDEVHRYLEHPEFGEDIAEQLAELVKVGPAAGYMLVLATQKPDAKAIPASIRDVIGTRFCLKTMNWQTSEAVLGQGTYRAGQDASKILRKHKGVGILLGADDSDLADEAPQKVRTHFMDGPMLTSIVDRAYQLRFGAGTLTGVAAGEEAVAEEPTTDLLRDTLAVFEAGEERLWSQVICKRLAEANPDAYDGWDPELLGKALAALGVETRQMAYPDPDHPQRKRRNLKGVDRRQLTDALESR